MAKGNKKKKPEKDDEKTAIKSSTDRVKKFRAIGKPKKDCHTAIRMMTGEETGSGKYKKLSALLVCADVLVKDGGWKNTMLMGGTKQEMKRMIHRRVEYTKTSRGYVGVAPPVLMANILRELKGGHIKDFEKEINWKTI
jgi:hypothetical protein